MLELTSIASPPASLVTLPTELQDLIFDYVTAFDVYVDDLRTLPSNDVLDNQVYPETSGSGIRIGRIAWVNLMQTCKSIASALTSYMREEHFLGNHANKEYVIDMVADTTNGKLDQRQATWQKLPCRPEDARTFTVNLYICNGILSCSNAQTTANWLLHSFDRLLRSGPRMADETSLPQLMCIQDFRVNIMADARWVRFGCVSPPIAGPRTDATRQNYLFQLIGTMGVVLREESFGGYLIKMPVDGERNAGERLWAPFPNEPDCLAEGVVEGDEIELGNKAWRLSIFFGECLRKAWGPASFFAGQSTEERLQRTFSVLRRQ